MVRDVNITVDEATCNRCLACVDTCPSHIYIRNVAGKITTDAQWFSMCITCGQCMSVCPTQSAKVGELEYERDFFEFTGETTGFDQFANALIKRRSVRSFSIKPIPKEVMERITSLFRHAPFGVSPVNAEVTIINDRKKIEEGLPYMRNFYKMMGKMFGNAAGRLMFRLMSNKEDYSTIMDFLMPMIKNGHYTNDTIHDSITREAPAVMLFHGKKNLGEHTADCWIMMNYAMISAHLLGLGTTIIGLIPPVLNQMKIARKIFNVPEGHEVVCALILGYPKHKYLRGYKAVERTVHYS
jgi:nitroreductase/NAD-dependent dihydropyrimidine dehydrogenase PreA subunit